MKEKRRGIFVAKDGRSVGPGDNRYESDMPRLQASLIKDPPHMDIFEYQGGTAYGTSAIPSVQRETLKTIPHNLPYVPELLIYFYAMSYNNDPLDSHAGLYGKDMFIMSGGAGSLTDVVYAEVDSRNIYMKHLMEDYFGIGVGGYTSDCNKYKFRVKFYILSNDSYATSYTTLGY